jgi:hypothetical protein
MSGAPLRAIVMTQPGTFVLLSGQPTAYPKRGESGSVRLQGFAHTAGQRSIRLRIVAHLRLMPSAWAPSVNATN